MKRHISLSLLLSLGLGVSCPTINTAQPTIQETDLSTKQLLVKWWKSGRKMNALTPAEQKKFNILKAKVGVVAIAAMATAAAAAFGAYKAQSKEQATSPLPPATKSHLATNKSRSNTFANQPFNMNNEPQKIPAFIKAYGIKGKDIDDGQSILEFAVLSGGSANLIQHLIQQGAPVSLQDMTGWTALHAAAQENKPEIATHLLAANARLDLETNNGHTPLDIAIQYNSEKVFDLLLSAGANVNTKDRLGDTPLHQAVRKKNVTMIKKLLAKGAKIAENNNKETPTLWAAQDKRPDIVQLLVRAKEIKK